MDRALCGVFDITPANMGTVERVACGLGVHCQSMCGLLRLPLLDQRVNCVNKAVLWDGVEKTDEVVIGGVEVDIGGCLGEVGMKMVPELWDG